MNDLLPPAHSWTRLSDKVKLKSIKAGLQAFYQLQNPDTLYRVPSPCDSESSDGVDMPQPPVANSSSGRSQTDSAELSQEKIQYNYYEFERMAAEKSQNVPDEECKAFEDIFLEDSGAEDWLEDIASLSDGLEDVSMEE